MKMMTAAEWEKTIGKLKPEFKEGRHRMARVWYEGKIICTTMRSHGGGDCCPADPVRKQLDLSPKEFTELRDCTIARTEFIEIYRKKKLLPGTENPPQGL